MLGSFSKKEPLGASERAFFKDADYRRFGGIDARSRLCIPGTVSSTTSANLPGLNSTVAGIPQTASGQALTVGNFTATAGQPNLCGSEASGSGTALVHGGQSSALHAAGDLRIGEAWSLFGELTFMRDHLRSMEGGVRLNNVLVPASNAFNPFGVPVRVTARMGLENGAEGFVRDTDYTRALVGVRGALSAGWDVEATASTSKDTGVRLSLNNTTSAPARTAALASSSPGTALNLFTTGRAASDEVLRNIWSDTVRENAGKKDQVSAFVRGPLLDLPAGSVDAIFGGEVAHDRFQILRTATDHDDRRQASAVYGELRAPLLRGDAGGGNGWNLAALTVAGRRDKYSDFGSASTYQAGIEVRPVPTVLLRASGATSFKPPTLLQTAVTDSVIPLDASIGLVDPERGNAPIASGELFRTTNHGLQPEQGKAYSVGVVWEPQASGSRVAVTAWRVNIDGLIALPSPQVTLNYESLFPGYVTRAQSVNGVPGVVTRILYQEINFGSVDTSGTDFDVSQSWQGAGGKWTLAGSATLTRKYGVVLAPGAPLQDRMGQRFQDYWAPKWKARLSAGVEAGAWGVALTGRYLGAYKDAGANPRRLGDYWVPDLSARLDLKKLGVGFDAGVKAARLSLSVVNLTNRLPEYVATFPYYDISQGDWRGRYASVRLSVDW